MSSTELVGTIRALWRYPVKSMLHPCAGVYAVAEATGAPGTDDRVSVV